LCFSGSVGRVVPYKELVFNVLPAIALVLGASAPIRQDLLGLEVLMEETLGAPIEVSNSPVPVRP